MLSYLKNLSNSGFSPHSFVRNYSSTQSCRLAPLSSNNFNIKFTPTYKKHCIL